MPLIIKLLRAMQTAAGANTLYPESPVTTSTIVKNIRFATGVTGGTVNLFFKPSGGTARLILNKDKSLAANDIVVVTSEITMAPGDTIEATTSVAMDCVVCGAVKV